MKQFTSFAFAALLVLAALHPAGAQAIQTASLRPVLRANVTVSADIVRIGDFVENAGESANIALFRAPDPGTAGEVPASKIVEALRSHAVIGVDTHNIATVTVTRTGRTITKKQIEERIANALAHRGGLGDAPCITLRFDGDIEPITLDARNHTGLQIQHVSFNPQTSRFEAILALTSADNSLRRVRLTGSAIEFVESTVLVRSLQRGAIVKQSDVIVERRPKAEVPVGHVTLERAVGMSLKRALRAGQMLQDTDLSRPELVQRNESVILIYEVAGIYLTIRGKALENGALGDVVSVTNLQSKRNVQGVVTAMGEITVSPTHRRVASLDPSDRSTSAGTNTTAE